MNEKKLAAAVRLAEELGHVFVATADSDGLPHLAAAGRLEPVGRRGVTVREWFCPGTLANLEVNRRVAVAVWASEPDVGFQLLGQVREIRELAVLDGFEPELEAARDLPQVERQLLIEVERVLSFRLGPHSDREG